MKPSPVLASHQSHADPDEVESGVMVSICADHLVIVPPARLDLAATQALVTIAASAVRSGSPVMIDLDPHTPSENLITRGPLGDRAAVLAMVRHEAVQLLRPGCIRFATAESLWTIDLAQSRLFRSEDPVEPRFVSADRWTPIQAVWVSCQTVTALAGDGSYISCRARWADDSDELTAVGA